MRNLKRNQSKIYYAQLVGTETDEWGNELKTGYGEILPYFISVSGGKGKEVSDVFGKDSKHDKELVTYDMDCPFTEHTRLWIDIEPTEPHNYEIKSISKTLNSLRFAIKKVNVNENN